MWCENSKAKLKKFIIFVAIILVAAIAIGIANIQKNIGIGSAVEKGNLKIVLKEVQFENTRYVIANSFSNDYLTPIQKEDLQLNDHFLRSTDEDMAAVVITVTAENIGKSDVGFGSNLFVLNYDDGNRYYADSCHAVAENGKWTEFNEINLDKVTDGIVEVRILAWIPNSIYDNSGSLTLEFMDAVYKIK